MNWNELFSAGVNLKFSITIIKKVGDAMTIVASRLKLNIKPMTAAKDMPIKALPIMRSRKRNKATDTKTKEYTPPKTKRNMLLAMCL